MSSCYGAPLPTSFRWLLVVALSSATVVAATDAAVSVRGGHRAKANGMAFLQPAGAAGGTMPTARRPCRRTGSRVSPRSPAGRAARASLVPTRRVTCGDRDGSPVPLLGSASTADGGEDGLDRGRPVDFPGGKAFPQQTPHSGRHFLPSHPSYHRRRRRSGGGVVRSALRRIANPFRRSPFKTKHSRFMEGWYYRVTLPEDGASFAFIFSVEDPRSHLGESSDLSLVAAQVMGPNDEYLVQCDRDESKMWAWEGSQGLGCTFDWNSGEEDGDEESDEGPTTAMSPEEWRRRVKSGFQILPNSLQGIVDGHDGSAGSVLEEGNVGQHGECTFDMTIEPLAGWGDASEGSTQRSTAGWLASFAVFEPHWQVTVADGRASGTITWKGKRYDFTDTPFYAEKNWGGSFPRKWYWAQCNAFEGYTGRPGEGPPLSVTAGGGIRGIPGLGDQTEELGMVSVHYDGTFYEAVPWTGDMQWDVDPWGKWILRGRCTSGERTFEAELIATCSEDNPGVVLRAPTKEDGMAYFCRDSFYADTTLSLWDLHWDKEKREYVRAMGPPIVDRARSMQGGVEVGGGPWWDNWSGTSEMKQPMRGLVKFPYTFQRVRRRLARK
uniref:Tocopherol cyclase n=1 Tax=Odontella aurita TaxID=265563 RepID=A0A7S4K291_9STRA|mmetsp:Transcript_59799/g.177215  ORF Transcript_59799/g.177215 Transcript_59799/m.177215 type:complete len:608 (+) Transcript_59799:196-2019(+)